VTLASAYPLADILEKEHQAHVVQVARTLGWNLVYHTHDSRRSAHGFPDLVLVRERAVFVELKREKGRLKPEQAVWLRGLLDAGCEAYLVRPRHLQALALILGHRGYPSSGVGGIARIVAELRDETRREAAA
jgi:hypothetical protein